ncbi:MAG: hypothetical protein RL234_1434, partial [Pseudomonadota bacterium]
INTQEFLDQRPKVYVKRVFVGTKNTYALHNHWQTP